MANRRIIVTVTTAEHAEIARRAGGQDKISAYVSGRLLGEPAAITAARYEMALESIAKAKEVSYLATLRSIATMALRNNG